MRITQSMLARVGIEQLFAQRNRLAHTQEQAATGLRINRPSDNPVDYRTAQHLKDSLSQTGRFLRTIDSSRSRLRTTELAISDSSEVVVQARIIALTAANSTNSGDARAALRIQVEGLFSELLDYSNARSPDGGFVFSGRASDTTSFVQAGSFVSGAAPPTVTFAGDASRIDVEIDEGVFIDVTRDGTDVFQGAVDIFSVLGDLWAAIDSGTPADASSTITDLDLALSQLSQERSQIGGAENKANTFESRLRLQEQDLSGQISFLEDADAFEVFSDLAAQEAALQASLQVTSRLLSPTLLDFI